MAERTIEQGTAVIRAMAEWCEVALIEDLPAIEAHVKQEAEKHQISAIDAMDVAMLGALGMMRDAVIERIRRHPRVEPGLTPTDIKLALDR